MTIRNINIAVIGLVFLCLPYYRRNTIAGDLTTIHKELKIF